MSEEKKKVKWADIELLAGLRPKFYSLSEYNLLSDACHIKEKQMRLPDPADEEATK